MYNLVNTVPTHYWNIHLAGDIKSAEDFARKFTFVKGWCVQLSPATYVYTGGLESGMIARVIRYPRFPKEVDVLDAEVLDFAQKLAEELCQKSFTIESSTESKYYESDNPLHKK